MTTIYAMATGALGVVLIQHVLGEDWPSAGFFGLLFLGCLYGALRG